MVNFATEKATIRYVPGTVTRADMVAAVEGAGYRVVQVDSEEELVDVEKAAREQEIHEQTRKLWVGVAFTLPLFLLSMARDFGLLGPWAHAPWVNYFFFLLATPVQFYTGWDYYVGGYKSLRNKSANMDVLVALGSSVAYFYSIVVMVGLLDGHVYFETSAAIITLIKVGKLLEARAKGKTSQAIKALMGLQAKTARVERKGVEVDIPTDQVQVGDIEVVDRKTAYENTPGYSEQQSTLNAQNGFALLIGVLVIGGFFQIQTLQKVPQIGMLKAIGTPNTIVALAALIQIVVVTLLGVAIGSLATLGLASVFPPNIPILLEPRSGAIAGASILLMGSIGGLVSIRYSLRVEPLIALGLSS